MSDESTQPVLDQEFMRQVIAYGFRWATKDCVDASGLPSAPVASRKPYEGEQIQRLGITGKYGMELHLKTTVTMRITKARGKCKEAIDLDLAIGHLIKTAALYCSEYFSTPGQTIGASNYPNEKSGIFVGILWNGQIIRMTFRAATYLDRPQDDPIYPRDPMEPFTESF